MVKYTSIIRAVNEKIKGKFPGIDVTSSDEVKSINRPSFMVDLDSIGERSFQQSYRDRELTIKIKYFASQSSKNKIENLDVIDGLSEIFITDDLLIAEGYSIQIYDEIDADIVDSVVHYNIPVFISEGIERIDDTPVIEDVRVNI